MATAAQDIPRRINNSLEKAQFDSSMVMIRHLAGKSEKVEAEYYFRVLMEQCKFLARKHGFKVQ